MRLPAFPLVVVTAIAWSSSAAADEGTKPKTAYLSFSPIHLSRPIGELTGEMQIGPRTSTALVLGAGAIHGQAYWKAGSQFLYYPWGGFEGIHLGLETSYAAYAGRLQSTFVVGPVNALSFSPVVGCKWVIGGGFTISTQAGASYAPWARDGRFAALYNLNVGWSF